MKLFIIIALCVMSFVFTLIAMGGFKVSYEERDDEVHSNDTENK